MGFNNIKINQTRVGAPKVLIVGRGDGEQNQFVKKVEALGCEVDVLTGDPGPVPDTYDACILLKSTISHQKFWQTKDVYSGKNLFVTSSGFSPIKEALEQFVFNFKPPAKDLGAAIEDSFRGVQIVPRIDSKPPSAYYKPADTSGNLEARFSKALGHVQKPPLPVVKPKSVATAVSAKKEIEAQMPLADTGRGKQIIKECLAASMTIEETLAMLKAENVVRKNGTAFTKNDIGYYRTHAKKELEASPPVEIDDFSTELNEAIKEVLAEPAKEVAPVEVVAGEGLKRVDSSVQRVGLSINDLLTSVLTGTHTMERKLELIAKINAGDITKTSGISTEVIDDEIGITRFDLNNANNNESFILDVRQAELVVEAAEDLLNFVMSHRKK